MENEKRMIDANKVIDSMQKCLDEEPDKKGSVAYFAFESIIECLKQVPTVDAVEVVRCKDCRHYSCGFCMHSQWWNEDDATTVESNDFCSYGERINDEEH